MKPPVREGDICRVLGEPDNAHVLCTAIERCSNCGDWTVRLLTHAWTNVGGGRIGYTPPRSLVCIAEANLWPLHDGDGVDETLAWAGRPSELPADVIREAAPEDAAAVRFWERTC